MSNRHYVCIKCDMGTFRYTIEIGDPQGQRWQTIEALVDTGASYTTLPASLLRRLGVQPINACDFTWPMNEQWSLKSAQL